MSCSLYENHWGSPTLTLLNVLGVLGVLGVLNVLNVLYVLNMLHGRIVGLLSLVFLNSGSDGRYQSVDPSVNPFIPPSVGNTSLLE